MTDRILEILAQLVACDTQNPPREICATDSIFQVITGGLGDGFRFRFQDYGKGRVSLLAQRGNPQRLFNVHLDTVPAGGGWTRPPLQLAVEANRAYGRGACDIKGAAACLVVSAASLDSDVAILFTSDEEGSENCCVAEFCRQPEAEPFREVVVAEPTGCQAVIGHRGYLSVSGHFTGTGGHTSQHPMLEASANHRVVRWAAAALEQVREFEQRQLGGESACFNIGRLDGGIKNNMIAGECRVSWSARLPAGHDNDSLMDLLTGDSAEFATWAVGFGGAPLPAGPGRRDASAARCQRLDLAVGDDVDFWTEAAIFSACGIPAIVLGPGDIAQAHTADEWVAVDQLENCAGIYSRLMRNGP